MIVADLIQWLKDKPAHESVFLKVNETGLLLDKQWLYTAVSTFDSARSKAVSDQETKTKQADDPLAAVRWICQNCTTVNGNDDTACVACKDPRHGYAPGEGV